MASETQSLKLFDELDKIAGALENLRITVAMAQPQTFGELTEYQSIAFDELFDSMFLMKQVDKRLRNTERSLRREAGNLADGEMVNKVHARSLIMVALVQKHMQTAYKILQKGFAMNDTLGNALNDARTILNAEDDVLLPGALFNLFALSRGGVLEALNMALDKFGEIEGYSMRYVTD